jgi:tRNA-dihydrouridine synthase 2
MRPTDRALVDKIRDIASICRSENIPCLVNGDIHSYTHAQHVISEYHVSGAMLARAAEQNPSCFRREGTLPSIDVAREFLRRAIDVDNHVSNTKFCLGRILSDHGKMLVYRAVSQAKNMRDLCEALEVEYTGIDESNLVSRGESSAAAKAAGGRFPSDGAYAGNMTHKHEGKVNKLRGVSSESMYVVTEEIKQTAVTV